MTQNGTWSPYAGTEALALAVALLLVGGAFAYAGTRLHRPVAVTAPGRTIGALLVLMWLIAFLAFAVAVATYYQALVQQIGPPALPADPITPITAASGLLAFGAIAGLCRRHGLRAALGSAIVGAIAGPMIFELPFDLIVMWRTYPPSPPTQFTLLFFLPLFLWELASFGLLTLSPATRVSRYTAWLLAAMFVVFAVWALEGFAYPLSPLPFACNAAGKVLSFAVAVSLFLPHEDAGVQQAAIGPAPTAIGRVRPGALPRGPGTVADAVATGPAPADGGEIAGPVQPCVLDAPPDTRGLPPAQAAPAGDPAATA